VIARPPRRAPEGGGLAVLVVVTVLAWLAAPQAHRLRPLVDQLRRADLPAVRLPRLPAAPPIQPPAAGGGDARAGRAVAFALAQRGKPYRWGAKGPGAYDCSGLTWAAWRAGRRGHPADCRRPARRPAPRPRPAAARRPARLPL
jgi:hypothetical protein